MLQQLTRARPFVVQPDAPIVTVTGYFYAVDLGDPVRPRYHRVGINGECACPLGRQCTAVDAVRAQRPPFGYYPVHPAKCPICKASTHYDASLSSRVRGSGWVCEVGGKSHYWQNRARILTVRTNLAARGKYV